jgi:hypothetical protein
MYFTPEEFAKVHFTDIRYAKQEKNFLNYYSKVGQ